METTVYLKTLEKWTDSIMDYHKQFEYITITQLIRNKITYTCCLQTFKFVVMQKWHSTLIW